MKIQTSAKYLLGLLCLTLLAACSPHRTIEPSNSYKGAEQIDKGDIVMSISSSGLYDVPISLFYRKVANRSAFNIGELSLDDGYKYTEKDHDSRPIFKSYARKYGQFSDQNSSERLHVVRLPAGEYEFYGMFIEKDYEQAEWTTTRDFSFKFTVVPGEVSYVGNFALKTKVIGNNDYIVESDLSRHNRLIDDKAVLHELFPSIDTNKVIVSSDIVDDKGVNIVRRHYGKEISLGGGRSG